MKQTCLLLFVCALPIVAQEKPPNTEAIRKAEQTMAKEVDPFTDGGARVNRSPGEWRKSATITPTQIRVEWLETDTKQTIKLLDGWKANIDAGAIRTQLMALEKTTVLESLLTQLDVGEKSSTENILELIYPTEYEPAELAPPPEELKKPEKRRDLLEHYTKLIRNTGSTPTAFETRNTGLTMEMALEPVKANKNQFDLRLALEKVTFCGMRKSAHHGLKAEMPLFATIRSGDTLRLKPGQWRLVKIQPALGADTGLPVSARRLVLFARIDRL